MSGQRLLESHTARQGAVVRSALAAASAAATARHLLLPPVSCAGEQPRTAGLLPPSDSEDESSEESGGEQEQQPKVVMIQVRCAALSNGLSGAGWTPQRRRRAGCLQWERRRRPRCEVSG